MNKSLEIKVYGAPATGKTVISRLIYETLKENGFEMSVICRDGDMFKRSKEDQDAALEIVKQQGVITVNDSDNMTRREKW